MSSFGIDGLASGLDTTSIINQLMQVERIPQQQLQSTLRAQTSSVTAYQVVASRLKSVTTAIAALAKDATWNAKATTVTGTSAQVTASAAALAGQTTIDVKSLATAARLTSTGSHALTDVVAQVPLTLTTPGGQSVTVTPASGTLQDVVSALNSTVGAGVAAVAVKVGEGAYRLQVRSTTTGAGTPFQIQGLTAAMDPVDPGTNAVYEVDGLSGQSPTNTVVDLVPGVTAAFQSAGVSTVTVRADGGRTTAAVKAVVDAVNTALDEIGIQGVRDSKSPRGPLAGDSQVRAIANSLVRAVVDGLGGRSSAELGIQSTRDGRLTFDEAAFTAALAKDPAGTRALLAPAPAAVPAPGSAAGMPDGGLMSRVAAVVDRATKADGGTITSSVQGREQRLKDLQTAIDSWDRRLEQRREMLQRQFSGLEVSLNKLQSQSSWLAGQLSALQASSAANR